MSRASSILAATLLLVCPAKCWPTSQFDQFFPSWNNMLQEMLQDSCSDWVAGYKNQTENAYRVIDCLLDEIKEYRKTEMAASAVILGLLPMILQSLDNSTVDLALLGIRRPLLAILLSISNPASSMTSSDAWVPLSIDRRLAPSPSPIIKISIRYSLLCRLLVAVIEYVVSVAAVANIAWIIYELSVHAIIAFAPKTLALLPVWLGLAFIIHVASTLILALRVRIKHPGLRRQGFPSWIHREFVPCVLQPPARVEPRGGKNGYLAFLGLRWLLDIGILAHTILGTLLFSSLLFFSVADSIVVVGRFAASALACKTILSLEMSRMIEVETQDEMEDYLLETCYQSREGSSFAKLGNADRSEH